MKLHCVLFSLGLALTAELSAAAPIGATPAELAASYQQSGWRVDEAATLAMGAVQSKADTDAVGAAVRAVITVIAALTAKTTKACVARVRHDGRGSGRSWRAPACPTW